MKFFSQVHRPRNLEVNAYEWTAPRECHARKVTSVQAFSNESYKQKHACFCGTLYQLLPPYVSFGAIPLIALPATLTVIQQAKERSASALTPHAQDLPFALSVNNNF